MPRKPIHDKPMSNAERARRYRDAKRGGPAIKPVARLPGASRTMTWRCGVVQRWAPELVPLIESGEMTVGRAFPVAQQRRDTAIMQALTECDS